MRKKAFSGAQIADRPFYVDVRARLVSTILRMGGVALVVHTLGTHRE